MSDFVRFVKNERVRQQATVELDKDLKKIAALTETAIKNRTPVKTGRLRNSFVAREVGFLDYEVATAVKYASYVEYGNSVFNVNFTARSMMRRGAADIKKGGLRLLTNTKRVIKI